MQTVTAVGSFCTILTDESLAAGPPVAGLRSARRLRLFAALEYTSAPDPFRRRTTASLLFSRTASPLNL